MLTMRSAITEVLRLAVGSILYRPATPAETASEIRAWETTR